MGGRRTGCPAGGGWDWPPGARNERRGGSRPPGTPAAGSPLTTPRAQAQPLPIRHAVPMRVWRRTHLGTEADRATFRTLHTASLASPALREGLTRASAERAVRHLRDLLGTPALAVTDTTDCLAWDGEDDHHEHQVSALVGDHRGQGAHPELRPRRPAVRGAGLPGPDRGGEPAGGRRADRRDAGGLRAVPDGGPRAGGRRDRPVGVRTARAGRARPQPHPADGGRGPRAAGPDQPALRLQLAERDRELRAHRPRPGAEPAAGVRGLHPLLLPPARRVHHAGRRAPLGRALPASSSRPGSATGCR